MVIPVKTMKKRIASLLAVIFCLTLLTIPAAAYGRVDVNKPVSLALTYKSGDTVVTGMSVSIYKVYDMTDAVRFTPTQAFLDAYGPTADSEGEFHFNVYDEKWQLKDENGNPIPNQVDWSAMASSLESLIVRDLASAETAEHAPDPVMTVETDEQGVANFNDPGMRAGIYLVMGQPKTLGQFTYTPQTFLIALPKLDGETDTWNYDAVGAGKMSVRDNGGGGGSTISVTILKVWDDEGVEDVERPESVEVQLLRNGSVYDTATLSEANNWRQRWTGLSGNMQWQAAEVNVPDGYSVTVERANHTFTITNTAETDIDDPDIPEGPAPSPTPGPDDPGTDIPDIDIPGSDIPDDDIPGGDMPGEPDEPDVDIPEDGVPGGDLPQTGVLWWPVQALTVAGILFFSVGWLDYRRGKRQQDEK